MNTRHACSADFQSAVSRISNPQAPGGTDGLPTGSRRYSRLETCATTATDAPLAIRERNSEMRYLIQNGLGGSLALPLEGFFRSLGGSVLVAIVLTLVSCGRPTGGPAVATEDLHLTTNGTVEVTAKLVEIPDGAIFKRDLYDYATILKYQVIRLHRGQVATNTIFVGHYNPWKPRAEAADKRVKNIGGTLKQFRAGETHRMALEAPIDDHFMGGIVNKYFGQETGPLYWAVWVNLAKE